MILFSHSRCYPGVATVLETNDPGGATVLPGSTPDSSRCMPVSPGSTTVRPGACLGCPRCCPGECRSRYGMRRWRHGSTPVSHGSSRFTPVCRAVNYLISQCCYDGFIHMKTKIHTVHVRAYELACWYFGNRGNA